MNGLAYIITGIAVMIVSSIAVGVLELWAKREKQKVRQEIYRIYD